MSQNDVVYAAFQQLVELCSNFGKIVGWAVEDAETLLNFAYNPRYIFDLLLYLLLVARGIVQM